MNNGWSLVSCKYKDSKFLFIKDHKNIISCFSLTFCFQVKMRFGETEIQENI